MFRSLTPRPVTTRKNKKNKTNIISKSTDRYHTTSITNYALLKNTYTLVQAWATTGTRAKGGHASSFWLAREVFSKDLGLAREDPNHLIFAYALAREGPVNFILIFFVT